MNIAIYIADLTVENRHLMPWRTILEVLHELQLAGHRSLLLSGRNNCPKSEKIVKYENIRVVEVPKPFSSKNRKIVATYLKHFKIESFFFPIEFVRNYSLLQELEHRAACQLIWYIPGGWFTPSQVLKASRHIGFKLARPYLMQALVPKRYFVKRITSIGPRPLVTMSDYTALQLRKCGYDLDLLFPAPPGKAAIKKPSDKALVYPLTTHLFSKTKYFLFFGPPSSIRGINQMIEAFSILAKEWSDIKLVCLFRGDRNVDPSDVKQQIEKSAFGDRIICFWDSVNGADLDLFIKNCFAVLKPFLIVPSEIPLAVLETAGYGKPVIGTGPDGTGDFIDKFGLTVAHGDSKALALAMEKLLNDEGLYEQKCQDAKKLYTNHPTWCEVSKIWLRAAEVKYQ